MSLRTCAALALALHPTGAIAAETSDGPEDAVPERRTWAEVGVTFGALPTTITPVVGVRSGRLDVRASGMHLGFLAGGQLVVSGDLNRSDRDHLVGLGAGVVSVAAAPDRLPPSVARLGAVVAERVPRVDPCRQTGKVDW